MAAAVAAAASGTSGSSGSSGTSGTSGVAVPVAVAVAVAAAVAAVAAAVAVAVAAAVAEAAAEVVVVVVVVVEAVAVAVAAVAAEGVAANSRRQCGPSGAPPRGRFTPAGAPDPSPPRCARPAWIVSPSMSLAPLRGALALGTTATENPSLAASRRRSWPRGAGRTSPARPTSPKAMKPLGSGLPRRLDVIASITARSAAGSLMRTPPTALTNTSWSMQATPACRCSTASSMARRSRSRPTDRRRGLRPPLSTSAWISTSIGRVPSSVTSTQLPGTGSLCCDRKIALGLATPFRPFSVIANTPISLTAPKRFLIARTSRKLECVSPSKYSTVSTMCSSTRGPGQRAFLGDMADQHDAGAAGLGGAREVGRAFAHLRHRAGRGGELVGVDGLDRIDHGHRGLSGSRWWRGSFRAGSRPAP